MYIALYSITINQVSTECIHVMYTHTHLNGDDAAVPPLGRCFTD